MPKYKVTIANMYTRIEEADSEDEAIEFAKEDNETFEYDEQRCVRIERMDDEH